MESDATRLAALAQDLEPFRRFALGRLKSADLADEALQEALLRAARHVGALHDDQRLTAWFWTILRRVIADLALARRDQRDLVVAVDVKALEASDPVPADVCRCLHATIDQMPPIHAEVLRAADLADVKPAAVAQRLGISTGALAVRRHRARAALGDALLRMCRTCARHGCLDCTCRATEEARQAPS